MKPKNKVQKFLTDIKKEGWLEEYSTNAGVTVSYMERMLKSGKYKPMEKTLRGMKSFSRRRLTRRDLEEHFSEAINKDRDEI